ncbi:SAP domain-containing protein [Convivina intestini]|uniref:SAP domain-containing protein n=1 Tax=Convivina intestini TaxID=1505726 RepID=A0A2U1DBI8_9LACO|nr:SAP domain-containing protein [Convivina intestini]PVY85064.1 SAP domain-containing protein [Convivina intestini]CAH1853576.1 hypothetical protein R077811_00741 [Convivina intestini]SDB88958.1 SAP domain-containing protein [Leuconostocaceae bacterium R-53105]
MTILKENQYYYKTDLQTICRQYGWPTSGTKAQLLARIESDGRQEINQITSSHKAELTVDQISPEMPLINSGFSFNQVVRDYFTNYYQVDNFHFTKQMATLRRLAQKNQDASICVSDLMDIYEGKRFGSLNDEDEASYQWNNFVHDFFADSSLPVEKNLRLAAQLWYFVKTRPQENSYTSDLWRQYQAQQK